jgi:hypothetical protein
LLSAIRPDGLDDSLFDFGGQIFRGHSAPQLSKRFTSASPQLLAEHALDRFGRQKPGLRSFLGQIIRQ